VAPALAHHSFAMFDRERPQELSGTVRDFQWTNPHVWIQLLVPNDAGGQDEWGVECTSVTALKRQGWSRTSLQPGDHIRLVIFPLRNGSLGGQLNRVVEINGSASQLPGYR
jgi:hypothetical protein